MPTVGAIVSFDTLTPSKRDALITLLADDDVAIYQAVRSRLLVYGPAICDWLRPFTLSTDPKLRRRANELLTFHARNAAHQRFLDFCQKMGESGDLEMGAGLLARTRFPEVNQSGYSAILDEWADTLRTTLSGLTESGEEIRRGGQEDEAALTSIQLARGLCIGSDTPSELHADAGGHGRVVGLTGWPSSRCRGSSASRARRPP